MATRFQSTFSVWDAADHRSVPITAAIGCLVLSVIFLVIRLVSRELKTTLRIDDGLAGFLLALVVVYCGLQISTSSKGLGLTIQKIQPGSRSIVSKRLFAGFLLFVVAAGCSSISVAMTCKLTLFNGGHPKDSYLWFLPGAIALVVLSGVIALAASFSQPELHTMDAAQFIQLRTFFTIYLTLIALTDLCTIGLMAWRAARLQMQRSLKVKLYFIMLLRVTYAQPLREAPNARLMVIRSNIPVSGFLCRSIYPKQFADDFTLQVGATASWIALSLCLSSFATAIFVLGGSLEAFDIRPQIGYAGGSYAMEEMTSKDSGTTTAAKGPGRTVKAHKGDSHSDQIPILQRGTNFENPNHENTPSDKRIAVRTTVIQSFSPAHK